MTQPSAETTAVLTEWAQALSTSPITRFMNREPEDTAPPYIHVLLNLMSASEPDGLLGNLLGYAIGRGLDVIELQLDQRYAVGVAAMVICRPYAAAAGAEAMLDAWDEFVADEESEKGYSNDKAIH